MVDLFSGENIRFAATDTLELLVCDVDNSTSAISDFTQSLHLRHPSWTVSILQEEVLHPVFFLGGGIVGKRMCQRSKVRTWMQLTQEYMLADRCENRQNWAVHPSYLLSSPLLFNSDRAAAGEALTASPSLQLHRPALFLPVCRHLNAPDGAAKGLVHSCWEGSDWPRKRLQTLEEIDGGGQEFQEASLGAAFFTAEGWVKIRACRSIRRIWAAVWWGWIQLFKSL